MLLLLVAVPVGKFLLLAESCWLEYECHYQQQQQPPPPADVKLLLVLIVLEWLLAFVTFGAASTALILDLVATPAARRTSSPPREWHVPAGFSLRRRRSGYDGSSGHGCAMPRRLRRLKPNSFFGRRRSLLASFSPGRKKDVYMTAYFSINVLEKD
ncbi:hypothetical protein ZWY2020_009031 [Hordeum vulgare]|nr:hypothetical protein ZWY2020_009031 [Hordeum vulgare]